MTDLRKFYLIKNHNELWKLISADIREDQGICGIFHEDSTFSRIETKQTCQALTYPVIVKLEVDYEANKAFTYRVLNPTEVKTAHYEVLKALKEVFTPYQEIVGKRNE